VPTPAVSAPAPIAVSPAASTSPPSPPSNEPSSACLSRFLSQLQGVLDEDAREPPHADAVWLARTKAAFERAAPGQRQVLIATVPDPIDSGLGYLFDTTLQALRLGMEAKVNGQPALNRDASWLPWEDAVPTQAERSKSEQCRRELPGMVLFRGAAERPELAVLLLVGETATTGVHRVSMVRALELSEALSTSLWQTARIVGPTFSGSASSLRASLENWNQKNHAHRRVSIVSGSATGGSLRNTLQSDGEASTWFADGQIEFWSTTVRETELLCRYLWRLERANPKLTTLDSVALLHESGTEFGSALTGPEGGCPLDAGVHISFPAHISALRDAYESMERDSEKDWFARRTTLAVSLREKRARLGMDAEPSAKTTFARDIAVSRVLSALVNSTVRHVVIQATDVADEIFMARKIRDAVPDVRLAFLRTDVLFLHPTFQPSLFGSFVVSPYPFLGASDFKSGQARHLQGFESSGAQGVFNAVLALRGAEPGELAEYEAPQGGGTLPVWVSVIGKGRFVPLTVLPNHVPRTRQDELRDVVFPGSDLAFNRYFPDSARFASFKDMAPKEAWSEAVRPLHENPLVLAGDVALPRFWRFLLLAVGLAFLIDRVLHRDVRRSLSTVPFPAPISDTCDQRVDRAIVRTKWRLYAAIRTAAIAATYLYLAMFWVYGVRLGDRALDGLGVCCVSALLVGAGFVVLYLTKDVLTFWLDYLAYAHSVGCHWYPWPNRRDVRAAWATARAKWTDPVADAGHSSLRSVAMALRAACTQVKEALGSWMTGSAGSAERNAMAKSHRQHGNDPSDHWDRATMPFGLARSESSNSLAELSFCQVRALASLALTIGLAFSAFQWVGMSDSLEAGGRPSRVLETLVVHRTLLLGTGVSPGAPTLAFLGVVYAWAVGRMGRLRLAHGLSQVSPKDGIADLVSTPIRLILYPDHGPALATDDAFTRVERRAINTILRPINGPKYAISLLVLLALPLVMFWLSPISTVELPLNRLLLSMHYVCSILIGNTIIQLFQYWIAFKNLLKRILEHPLGRAFDRVRPFVQESIHEQVSRTPNDLLRLAACASEFCTLTRWGQRLTDSLIEPAKQRALQLRGCKLRRLRARALSSANSRNVEKATRDEGRLGEEVIRAASVVMKLLWPVWRDELPATRVPPSLRAPSSLPPELPRLPGVSRPPPKSDPWLKAEAWRYSPQELQWVRDAESFAATVVAVLLNRYVRQLQYFVYTLLFCALLLMLGALSYPFEPHRLLSTWVWTLMLVVIGSALWTYVELDRNTLLSRIASSSAGQLTLDRGLLLRVLAWGVAPLMAAAATEYPDLVNSIFQLVSFGH